MSFDGLTFSQQDTPGHIAIIMDGNGRWAQQRNKPRVWGHKNGVAAVRRAVTFCRKNAIATLTLFAFSSENWQRPKDEVSTLMDLFMLVLGKEVKKLDKNNVRLRVIGDRSRFSRELQDKIAWAEQKTEKNTALMLNIAANYGGRWDIAEAAKQAAQECIDNGASLDSINEQSLNRHMCLAGQPPLDLLIRTGGDCRISNFLIWQAAYAELYFSNVLWPDFDEAVFTQAIAAFADRERRYGHTGEQVKQQTTTNIITKT